MKPIQAEEVKEMKKRKIRIKGLSLRKNKGFFGTFAVLFSLSIIIGATLAWTSYSEWVKNHTQSNAEEIAVKVSEVFKQDSVMKFEEPVQKEVKVKNISNRKAIVRVRFTESVMPFVMDMTDGAGNGNIKIMKRSGEDLIELQNKATWITGNLLETETQAGDYYQAGSPIIVDHIYKGEANRSSSPASLQYFSWAFHDDVYYVTKPGNAEPYWVLAGDYFYYSKVLKGSEETKNLLEKVGFADVNVPNSYKRALYDIQVEAEGVGPTEAGVASWTSNTSILAMYKEDFHFGK